MGLNFRKTRPEEPEINLIPFIAVLLVILIFPDAVDDVLEVHRVQVTLPVADAEKARDRPNEIIVSVAADGRYAVNRKPVAGRSVEVLTAVERGWTGATCLVIVSADATAATRASSM